MYRLLFARVSIACSLEVARIDQNTQMTANPPKRAVYCLHSGDVTKVGIGVEFF